MPQCAYPDCHERDDLIELEHEPTERTHHYCEGHAPSGDAWEGNDD